MNPDLLIGTGDESLLEEHRGRQPVHGLRRARHRRPRKNGTLTVEIKGVDVYDPTTGQIRNASTDDIACWFIDTDYNGESFFVRHAYFTGADEPYEKLKRASEGRDRRGGMVSRFTAPPAGPFPGRQARRSPSR